VHSARRLRPATPRPCAPSLPKLPAPTDVPMDVPSALADPAGREAAAHTALALQQTPSPRASSCTVASAGRSVEHITHELLLPSTVQSTLVHVVLCRAAMGGQARAARKRTCRATKCEVALPPTQPKVGFGVAGRAGEGRGAFPRRARRSARWCQCLHRLVRLTELIGGLFVCCGAVSCARCRLC
jgi:hypothetical protein